MTLPQLTWNIVGPKRIASGSNTLLTQAKPKSYIMDTIRDMVTSSSYWSIDIQDTTGSMLEALVLKPNAVTSATPNMRIICTMNVSGVLGGSAVATIMANRTQTATADTVETATANRLMMGFSPNVSPAPTWVTGSWNSDRPWGNSVRWSKYWSTPTSNAYIEQMYMIESSETLWIGIMGNTGNLAHYGIGAGAYIVGIGSGTGEQDNRVYCMTCIGTTMVANMHNAETAGPFGHVGTSNDDHTCIFIVSGGVANGPNASGALNINTIDTVRKLSLYSPPGANPTAFGDNTKGTSLTSEDTFIGQPIVMTNVTAPGRIVGVLRQIYAIQPMASLQTVYATSGSFTLGYTLSQNTVSTSDALFFSNI